MPPSTSKKPRTVERRVRGLFIVYTVPSRGVDGSMSTAEKRAEQGELVALTPIQAAHFDSLGMLAAPGATVEDIERELDASYSEYHSARQAVASSGAGF
jgi:hypothetical protein